MERIAHEKRQKLEAGTLDALDVRELAHALIDHLFDALDAHDDGTIIGCRVLDELVSKCESAGAGPLTLH